MPCRVVRKLVAASLLVVLSARFIPAEANTYYVATNGNDVAEGTNWVTAVQSISVALTKTSPAGGDTVFVSNGVYTLTGNAILITNGTTVVSVNGYRETVVTGNSGNTKPFFDISHTNAVLDGFRLTGGVNSSQGAAVRIPAGTVRNCYIDNNTGAFGALFILADAQVQNCIIVNNTGTYAGAVYYQGAGTLENCTIFGNTASNAGVTFSGGLCFRNNAGTARNCIVYGNTNTDVPVPAIHNWGGKATLFDFSCTTPSPGGEGIVTEDPMFADTFNGDFRLQGDSACIDAGTNLLWIADAAATDIDGEPRILNDIVDIGAYEGGSGLSITFTAAETSGIVPHEVAFTAFPSGETQDLYYRWSFTNAAVVDAQGYDLESVNHAYGLGYHSPRLQVSNSLGEVAAQWRPRYIHAGYATTYVSRVSSPEYPFATWETAADSIQTAIDYALDNSTILVGEGTYTLSAPLDIQSPLTVLGVEGHERTVIDGNNSVSVLTVNHAAAVVDGFTITRADTSNSGTALRLTAGLVQNCHIVSNRTGYAIYMADASLRNCLIEQNTGYYAGAIWIKANGTIESCTIARNVAEAEWGNASGGIIFRYNNGTVRNSIVYDNVSLNTLMHNWSLTPTMFEYSCTVPDPGGTGIVTNDPFFANAIGGDYSLHKGSPCIDTGQTSSWALEPGAIDLAGKPRLGGEMMDMGAYEYQRPLGTLLYLR